jgi:hypothetical protein
MGRLYHVGGVVGQIVNLRPIANRPWAGHGPAQRRSATAAQDAILPHCPATIGVP